MTRFTLPLPENYQTAEIMSFHGRDREGFAETIAPDRIRKGLVVHGIPVVLTIRLKGNQALCQIDTDGKTTAAAKTLLTQTARNLLALNIDPAPFAKATRRDPLFGPLVRKNPHLRIPQTSTPFEALTWAIIGQQIHLSFAVSLRRTFIRIAGQQHSSGLWCYPDPAAAARIEPEQLTPLQFSRSKAEALVRVARLMDSGALPLDDWKNKPQPEIEAALLAIKGIGPWTVNYALMRGFGHGDCSLHGDAAIRNAVHRLTASETKPTPAAIQSFLENYQPHRSMAAAHLWASL